MLNGIFVAAIVLSVLLAAITGRMEALTQAALASAKSAVELALGLIGAMAFFLGLMRVASDAGLLKVLSRAVAPLLRWLFPAIPSDHPAASAMILNIASTMLGLGNAATPFGIKAMMELDRLNGSKGTATDAMVLFLAINTSGFALLPTAVIALRASAGSSDPAGILFPTWVASGCATLVGVAAAVLLARLPRYRATSPPAAGSDGTPAAAVQGQEAEGSIASLERPPRGARAATWIFALAFGAALVAHVVSSDAAAGDRAREILSYWLLPAGIAGLVLFGWARGVRVYDSIVEGAKEGFQVAVRIIPYLVAILVMAGMVRASGGTDLLVRYVGPLVAPIGMPAEALPMALLRPLSGSGAYGWMSEILVAHGPDSFLGYLVGTLQGSTETTFYVLAVYFGAVGIRRTRHALPACLLADAAGIVAAVLIARALFL